MEKTWPQEAIDFGMVDLKQTRTRILKLIGNKKFLGIPKVPLTLRNISRHLYGCEDVIFDNENTIFKSQRQFKANYWKSTDITENLEALSECDLVDTIGNEYVLTKKGEELFQKLMGIVSRNKTDKEKE